MAAASQKNPSVKHKLKPSAKKPHKSFDNLEHLGWTFQRRPKITVEIPRLFLTLVLN